MGILNWSELIPDPQWHVYRDGLKALVDRGLRFAVGGGYAFSAYALRWRNTKDMDIYVLPDDREAVIDALGAAGFDDYASQSPYDRSWSFRGFRDGTILDVLWAMCNRLTPVKEAWLTSGPELDVRGMRLRLLPVEELIWVKLYVFQRDRCDWPDLLNLLYAQGPVLNWRHLLEQVGEDRRLLGAALALLGWICPARSQELPEWVWEQVGVSRPVGGRDASGDSRRAALLDGRDWFGPNRDERTAL